LSGTRFGVFGGTFDPIHNGHLHIAEQIERAFALSQTLFVVTTTPPHKIAHDVLSFNHRYVMVCLATAAAHRFIPSMAELEPPASPFSIDTMAKLSQTLTGGGQASLYFIAGTDSLMDVTKWHRAGELLVRYSFVFVVRPGVSRKDIDSVLPNEALRRVRDLTRLRGRRLREEILAEEKQQENRIFLVDVDAPNISASHVRALAAAGKSIRQLVPAPVHAYIRKIHLYGGYERHAENCAQRR
jgi:nicotinate-nucleotide adenylyltransferase